MENPGAQYSRRDCRHCDLSSPAYNYRLVETGNFIVVADAHPLIEGHILIIPKQHIACVAEYPRDILSEFMPLYSRIRLFVQETYGSESTFEHGEIGQTVFHSHVHVLPFEGEAQNIVQEGVQHIQAVAGIQDVREQFEQEGRYLFFSIGDLPWTVDTSLGAPRFFRDRFAAALHAPERADWEEMHNNAALMESAHKENKAMQEKWMGWEKQ